MSSRNSNKKLGKILQHRDMQAVLFKSFFTVQEEMFNFNFSEKKHRISLHY
jgi:hypothetical protein